MIEIGTFQKLSFWHQKFVLLAYIHGKSYEVSKMKFVQLAMFHW